MPFYKRQLRLPPSEYRGRRIYFSTICTENREPFFSNLSSGTWVLEKLLNIATEFSFRLHAYCAMPDHLHFLAESLSEESDLVKFINSFKQRTAHQFKKLNRKRLWQSRYYDHILRPNEAIEDAACYIWWNPVRKNLCVEPNAYPLSGSQSIDWMKKSPAPTTWKPPWKP